MAKKNGILIPHNLVSGYDFESSITIIQAGIMGGASINQGKVIFNAKCPLRAVLQEPVLDKQQTLSALAQCAKGSTDVSPAAEKAALFMKAMLG